MVLPFQSLFYTPVDGAAHRMFAKWIFAVLDYHDHLRINPILVKLVILRRLVSHDDDSVAPSFAHLDR